MNMVKNGYGQSGHRIKIDSISEMNRWNDILPVSANSEKLKAI